MNELTAAAEIRCIRARFVVFLWIPVGGNLNAGLMARVSHGLGMARALRVFSKQTGRD
jgi:hypothetical protein